MKDRIAGLSPRVEAIVVLGLTFGLNLTLFALVGSRGGFQKTIAFSEGRLLRTVLVELVLAAVLAYFLYRRGWRLPDFHLQVSPAGTGIGVLLWMASLVLYVAAYAVFRSLEGRSGPLSSISFHGHIGLPVALLACAVNPLFEELLALGYVVRAFQSHGPAFAVGVSALLRLSAHAYQGPIAVVAILPMGLLFAGYFWRYRQLWPPVFAHVVADLIGLLSLQ